MPLCHVRYNASLFDPIPIWAALRKKAGTLRVNTSLIAQDLAPTAIAIDVRGRILREVVKDLKHQKANLLNAISNQRLMSCSIAVTDAFVYNLLRAVDSFFFESWSIVELTRRFYVSLLRRAKIATGRDPATSFVGLVRKSERRAKWKKYLERHRHFLTHLGSPYLAIEFSPSAPHKRDILLESHQNSYLRIGDFDNVLQGLALLLDLCTKNLIHEIDP